MTTVGQRLTEEDLAALAQMHAHCLPESMVTRMGQSYVHSFYRYVHFSDQELLIVQRSADDGPVVGGCVVSLSPHTLTRRMMLHTPLLLWLALRFYRLPWRGLLKRGKAQAADTAAAAPPSLEGLPELLLIFTAPEVRGQGHGAQLMRQAEAQLRQKGVSRYMLKTIDDLSNPAFAFYDRQGLDKHHRIQKQGRAFRVWTKFLID